MEVNGAGRASARTVGAVGYLRPPTTGREDRPNQAQEPHLHPGPCRPEDNRAAHPPEAPRRRPVAEAARGAVGHMALDLGLMGGRPLRAGGPEASQGRGVA